MTSIDKCILVYSFMMYDGTSNRSSSGILLFLFTVFPFSEGISGPKIFLAIRMSLLVKGLFPITLCSTALARSMSLGHARTSCSSLTLAALLQSIAEKCALSPITVWCAITIWLSSPVVTSIQYIPLDVLANRTYVPSSLNT